MIKHFTKRNDLIGPAAIQFATAYLSDCKIQLMTMFTSIQWRSYRFSKTKEGKRINSVINSATQNKMVKKMKVIMKTFLMMLKQRVIVLKMI
jgi:hypothetical protein